MAYVAETNEYVPIDGFHRLMAIEWLHNQNVIQTDANTEEVEIRYSKFDTMSEAIIAAAGVNATHGLKRQKGDIQNAIRTLLEVDRIGFMENKFKLNKKKIMATVKCSARTYEQETKEIRAELERQRNIAVIELYEEGITQREITSRTGVPQKTVSRILGESNTHSAQMTQGGGEEKVHDVNFPLGDSNTHNAQMNQSESNTHSAQMGQEDEQEPSVFNHITMATVAANPWAEFERETEVSTKQKSRKINLCDDELIEILSGLSSQQRTLALNYLSDF
ncbi:helix-turn-helix domain-containing protein [Pseudoalteromonas marina]|nr:helix-turn-helix domain-containing protein [Pseudoalteromonas marina]